MNTYFCSGSAFGLTMEAIFLASTGAGLGDSLTGCLKVDGVCAAVGVNGAFGGSDFTAFFSASCAALLTSFSFVACAIEGTTSSLRIKSTTSPCSSGLR